jgi:uracil-DNA glycosylase family 4
MNPDFLAQIEDDWLTCQRCPLGGMAHKHVLWERLHSHRPVRLVMVGEGPGMSEDTEGRPFWGPAGQLLRKAIKEVSGDEVGIVLMNLLACRPQDRPNAAVNRSPQEPEIKACRPRLIAQLIAFQPMVILTLGNIPEDHISPALDELQFHYHLRRAQHPSFLQRTGKEKSPAYPKFLEDLREACVLSQGVRREVTHTETRPLAGTRRR